MTNIKINPRNQFLIFVLFTFIIIQIYLVLIIGLELYKTLIVSFIFLYSLLVFVKPYYSIFLIIIISFFIEGKDIETYYLFKLFGFNWYLMDISILITFLGISFRYLLGEYSLKFNSIVLWTFIFFLVCFIGVIGGLREGYSNQDVFFDLRGFFYYIIFIPVVFLINDFDKLKKIFFLIIILGTIKCTMDTFRSLYFLPKTFDDISLKYLPFARLKGYNEVVYPLTLIAVLTYFYFSKNIKTKLLLIPSIFFSFSALFLSYTRGSWVSALSTIIIGIFFLIKEQKFQIKSIYLIVSICIFFIFITLLSFFDIVNLDFFFTRITSLSVDKIDISNLGRLVEYATALSAFTNSPIHGVGLGYIFTYFSPGIGYVNTIYCHNSYLYVLSKLGIIGLIPFLLMIFSSLRIGIKILRTNLPTIEVGVVFGFSMMFLMLVIKSLTTWHLNTVTFSLFVGVLLGISIIYKNKIDRDLVG